MQKGGTKLPNVVIVHDYLNQLGGAERVVGALHKLFPEAPIYTLFVDRDKLWPELQNAQVIPSVLQHIPFIRNHFKLFFWLYPLAMRTLRIPDCDVVISSSSAYAKGVRVRKTRGRRPVHVSYCHTPMRFAWNFDAYMKNETRSRVLKRIAQFIVPWLKWWDVRTARGVDIFVANSSAVQQRILTTYGRDAIVVHPPVDVFPAGLVADAETATIAKSDVDSMDAWARIAATEANVGEVADFYLIVSRLVSYKRIDLAVETFTKLDKPLVVIGEGPDRARIESLAGPNVRFLGWQPEAMVHAQMATCQALIFPGQEDFGITPLEVHTLGRPVVAFQAGGALDTIIEGLNGVFFAELTLDSLGAAIRRAELVNWDKSQIQKTATKFATQSFKTKLLHVVQNALNESELVVSANLLEIARDSP